MFVVKGLQRRQALSAKVFDLQAGRDRSASECHPTPHGVDSSGGPRYGFCMEAFWQFVDILTKPDNIPIVFMMVLVLFFTWLGFKQALRNDRLVEQGREDEILKEMQR
jgi:hypothetical protein